MELEESQDGVCIRTLVANISEYSDWIRAVSSLFDSPCLGLYRRKEISSIGSLDVEIFAINDRVRIFRKPVNNVNRFISCDWRRPSSVLTEWSILVLVVLVPS